ncbi:MAG: D-alanyl-D-alanine carboxypeptidase (penicillin-binding protein 5/6) [Gammaproteobacteria bacterium]|nr:MAG: D-alanyl-D-alanine carboxypeptidase (penicillin-binding protein 5/6) [Gammaproteobacteria bacterium]TND06329.1 MAG: D-alanyl-D-alanine carboxypeptidase (penicillin-binding protein 5/6) [Gammaproteobacteria bacterium]
MESFRTYHHSAVLRRLRRPASLIALLAVFACNALAAPRPVPTPPGSEARAFLLLDFLSGQTIAEKNADDRVEPASLTKLMTAYIVFDELRLGNIKLQDNVLISEKAWRMEGSRMFVEVNNRVSVEDLLQGMIIQSGNDATVALAEHIAGSEDAFVNMMNLHAARLGMTASLFANSSGMPDANHYTTARDLGLLTRALIRNFPEHYKWYSVQSFTFNGITQHNRNKLLARDQSVDGVKTGYTESAGYCLITSAQRDNMRLISVVLGTSSENARAEESQKMLNYGFRFFETHKLYDSGKELARTRIYKGAEEEVPLGLSDDLYVTVSQGRYKDIQASLSINSLIMAPAAKGQPLGLVNVTLDGDNIAQRPLLALQEIAEGGWWQRLTDATLLLFQ